MEIKSVKYFANASEEEVCDVMQGIIEVYYSNGIKVTHYEYDGSTEGYFRVIKKIQNKMQDEDYYTKVVTIQEF